MKIVAVTSLTQEENGSAVYRGEYMYVRVCARQLLLCKYRNSKYYFKEKKEMKRKEENELDLTKNLQVVV